MQWTHPGVFWALLLLIIPLLIHLFEWRRFRNFSFTNLKMLEEVEETSRKTKNLKKLLLLISRLLALTALVLAFVQPVSNRLLASRSTTSLSVYLDNSYSMQAPSGNVSMLEMARQELLKWVPADVRLNVLTNDGFWRDIDRSQLQSRLMELRYTPSQLRWQEIQEAFAAAGMNSEGNDCLLISDFQDWADWPAKDYGTDSLAAPFSWRLMPDSKFNSFIDTVQIQTTASDVQGISIQVQSVAGSQVPMQVRINDKPYSNTSLEVDSTGKGRLYLQLPERELFGLVEIRDASIAFDNRMFFSLQRPDPTRVLGISDTGEDFLSRLFDFEEFEYAETRWRDFNYGSIGQFDVVVLNEVYPLPSNMISLLERFLSSGGRVMLIPAGGVETNAYNALLNIADFRFTDWQTGGGTEISLINYDHPVYREVFARRNARFDYPIVRGRYRVEGNAAPILSYSDGLPFFTMREGLAVFTAPLGQPNSDFQNSPLIVPTVQNALRNQSKDKPYLQLGEDASVELPVKLSGDQVIRLTDGNMEYIPAQSRLGNLTRLEMRGIPTEAGIHYLVYQNDTLNTLAFNADRQESSVRYADPSKIIGSQPVDSLSDFFGRFEEARKGTQYWKWLLFSALVFLIAEWLIQKVIP